MGFGVLSKLIFFVFSCSLLHSDQKSCWAQNEIMDRFHGTEGFIRWCQKVKKRDYQCISLVIRYFMGTLKMFSVYSLSKNRSLFSMSQENAYQMRFFQKSDQKSGKMQ